MNAGSVMSLREKIETRQAIVSIIGLGYVGLPLAVTFANSGFRVIGIDVDETRVAAIKRGESYIQDVPSEDVARLISKAAKLKTGEYLIPDVGSGNMLSATTDYDALHHVDAAIICVPTPLSKTRDPDLSNIIAASDEVATRLHTGMLIVLESTTYPGTTREVLLARMESANGEAFHVGKDFFLAFSPERVDPGRIDWTMRDTPKVIGGVTPDCLKMVKSLYESVMRTVVPVSSPEVAEMVKLLENTFRAVNIALVNEVAIMCDRLGVDVWEVIEAAKTKPFGYMPFYPGPGSGGHCIPVDPHYLAWKMKTLNYNARFIQLAAEVNFGMPAYIVGKIANALNEKAKALKGSRVLLLGVTYKADVADVRESPALELIRLLREKGANVSYHDPYVPHLDIDGGAMTGVPMEREHLRVADCVVITTDHKCYDWNWVVENSELVMDTRNATRGVAARSGRVVKL